MNFELPEDREFDHWIHIGDGTPEELVTCYQESEEAEDGPEILNQGVQESMKEVLEKTKRLKEMEEQEMKLSFTIRETEKQRQKEEEEKGNEAF